MSSLAHTLFSRNYAMSRQAFLAAAQARGLAVDSYILDLPGVEGETLATDVVLDGPEDAENLIITISGVHGVEGYPGSAIQKGLLEMGPLNERNTAVLHVHAINPWGFSWSHRTTQENVDLNRNFVDFNQTLPANERYSEIHDLLLPSSWPPPVDSEDKLRELAKLWGAKGFQCAVSLGQYRFADGLHYGGDKPTWSNDTFRAILRRYATRCRRIGSLDIHTGLGPYGYGERIFGCEDEGISIKRARDWWGDTITSVNTGSSTSVPLTGPIQAALFRECEQAQQTNICLEYGTYPQSQTVLAMRGAHWLTRYGSDDPRQCAAIRQTLKDAFNPQDPWWQEAIWAQGKLVFQQAVAGINRNQD